MPAAPHSRVAGSQLLHLGLKPCRAAIDLHRLDIIAKIVRERGAPLQCTQQVRQVHLLEPHANDLALLLQLLRLRPDDVVHHLGVLGERLGTRVRHEPGEQLLPAGVQNLRHGRRLRQRRSRQGRQTLRRRNPHEINPIDLLVRPLQVAVDVHLQLRGEARRAARPAAARPPRPWNASAPRRSTRSPPSTAQSRRGCLLLVQVQRGAVARLSVELRGLELHVRHLRPVHVLVQRRQHERRVRLLVEATDLLRHFGAQQGLIVRHNVLEEALLRLREHEALQHPRALYKYINRRVVPSPAAFIEMLSLRMYGM